MSKYGKQGKFEDDDGFGFGDIPVGDIWGLINTVGSAIGLPGWATVAIAGGVVVGGAATVGAVFVGKWIIHNVDFGDLGIDIDLPGWSDFFGSGGDDGDPDGIVQGTSDGDIITPTGLDGSPYFDDDPDFVDSGDAILRGESGNDDIIFGFDGNDSINGGLGNDEIFGGSGNDFAKGGEGDDLLSGGVGNDTLLGEEGDDTVFGGEGNDLIHGDNDVSRIDGEIEGSDSLQRGLDGVRAVELVEVGGRYFLVGMQNQGSGEGSDGIFSYEIDGNPNSATYGEVISTNGVDPIDSETDRGNGSDGYDDIRDIDSFTLSNGNVAIYTADASEDAIGITILNGNGQLTRVTAKQDSNDLDDVTNLTIVQSGGRSFLIAHSDAEDRDGQLTSYEINATTGELTERASVADRDGSDENYLDHGGAESLKSALTGYTDSSGNAWVVVGGDAAGGISLWAISSNGQMHLADTRDDDEVLSRDVIQPDNTGIGAVDDAAFFEIDGATYVAVGGNANDINVFRIDGTGISGELTLVGDIENIKHAINSIETVEIDGQTFLAIGGEGSGITLARVEVEQFTGAVDLITTDKVEDGTNIELADSEDIAFLDGLIVSASNADNGIFIGTVDGTAAPAGNDELWGNQGEDTIFGKGGNDFIAGGEDDDLLHGGSGNDTIYGDSAAGLSTGNRESFNWDDALDQEVDNGFLQNTGSVTVIYDRTSDDGDHFSQVTDRPAQGTGIDTGGGTFDRTSSLRSDANENGAGGDFRWTFSEAVGDLQLNINGIDANSQIVVRAWGPDGELLPIELTAGSNIRLSNTEGGPTNDTATSNGSRFDSEDPRGLLQIEIPGPVVRLVIEHDQVGNTDSGVNISDLYFTVLDNSEDDGDDVITGGDGNDVIYGEGGSDNLSGEAGNDRFVVEEAGDANGDVVVGGNGPNQNTDNDILDLRGAGRVAISKQADTSDANSFKGTVTFEDGSKLNFSQIETFLTDGELNNAPDARDDAATVSEDGRVTISVLNNDSDPDGDPLTVISATSPDGNVTINGDGTLTFAPDTNFNGPTTITYTVRDPGGLTDTAEVSIRVNPINDRPDARNDFAATDEDTPVVINVLANDRDPDGDRLTVISANSPDGDVTINSDGTLTFAPDANFNGLATITYTVRDTGGLTDTAEVSVRVRPVNDDPNARDDVATTDEDTSVVINVLDNDVDVDGDLLTVTSASSPQGDVTINGDGSLTFEPDAGFNGPATITYTVSDGNGGQDTATVDITVNPGDNAPVTTDDTATTDEDTPVTIDPLANDSDPDGQPLVISGTPTADNGTVTVNPDGTIEYTPDPDFNGTDTITYAAADSDGNTTQGTIVVTVGPINDAPDAVNDTASTDEDAPIIIDVLNNDTDVDGDLLKVTAATVPAEQGTVEVVGNQVLYTPADDFFGSATISYSVSDGNGGTDVAEVVVDVANVNDAPVAKDDIATTDEDTPVVIDLLGNDTDVDGDLLTISDASVSADQGSLVDNGDGTVTFTPAPNFNGPATITYTVIDGQGGEDDGTVTVNVGAVNDAPMAADDTADTDEDTAILIDVLDNDSDPDGDPLRLISATVAPEEGTVEIVGDEVLFTPAENFNGDATISYTASDGNGLTDTAQLVVTVAPVNDAPEAVDDTAVTGFETAVVIDVLANDIDVDGDALSVTAASSPNGEVTIGADGRLTFTPADGFAGEATITYTVTDTDNASDTAIVTITVASHPADGVVDGEETGELMDPLYNDANGPTDGGGDIIDGPDGDDDTILGNGGNDTINAGAGNDTVDGGADDDVVNGGVGNDILSGGDGNDSVIGGVGDDILDGGKGDDSLTGASGDDVIDGNAGTDTIDGGDGDDTVDGGGDDDVITGGDGSDSVIGGAGDDIIDTSGPTDLSNGVGLPDSAYPGVFAADPDPENDRDIVDGGAGNDVITTGDDADTITGGSGSDTIDGGIDADVIDGGDDGDRIVGGEGADDILGGSGDDTIFAGNDPVLGLDQFNIEDDGTNPFGPDLNQNNGKDTVSGGDGDDSIFGADDDDLLMGDAGNDTIDGGIDDDTIMGGANDDLLLGGQGNDSIDGGTGDDVIDGGIGNDSLFGGDDQDSFVTVNAGDTVDGGEGGNDFDTLDLTGSAPAGGSLSVNFDPVNGENGVVNYFDATGNAAGSLAFTNIENVVPCFTPGTAIATPRGEVLVENLRVGDKVITRDNGFQEIRWIGTRTLDRQELVQGQGLMPIQIKAGSLGPNLPDRDMLVSPQHRVLLTGETPQFYFDDSEVLVAAKHLVGKEGVSLMDATRTTYVHFMFDRHEVVLSNGAWTESFQPGDQTLGAMGDTSRDEILALFPELTIDGGLKDYAAARRVLKKHEALLVLQS